MPSRNSKFKSREEVKEAVLNILRAFNKFPKYLKPIPKLNFPDYRRARPYKNAETFVLKPEHYDITAVTAGVPSVTSPFTGRPIPEAVAFKLEHEQRVRNEKAKAEKEGNVQVRYKTGPNVISAKKDISINEQVSNHFFQATATVSSHIAGPSKSGQIESYAPPSKEKIDFFFDKFKAIREEERRSEEAQKKQLLPKQVGENKIIEAKPEQPIVFQKYSPEKALKALYTNNDYGMYVAPFQVFLDKYLDLDFQFTHFHKIRQSKIMTLGTYAEVARKIDILSKELPKYLPHANEVPEELRPYLKDAEALETEGRGLFEQSVADMIMYPLSGAAADVDIKKARDEAKAIAEKNKQRADLTNGEKIERLRSQHSFFEARLQALEKALANGGGVNKEAFDKFTISNMTEIDALRRDLQELDAQNNISSKKILTSLDEESKGIGALQDITSKHGSRLSKVEDALDALFGPNDAKVGEDASVSFFSVCKPGDLRRRAKQINKDFLGFSVYKYEQKEKEKKIENALTAVKKELKAKTDINLDKTVVLENIVGELKNKVESGAIRGELQKQLGIVKAAIEDKAKLGDERHKKLYADMQDVIGKFNDVNSKTESINRAMEEQGKQFGTQIDFLSKRFTELGAQLQKGNELSEEKYDDLLKQYNALHSAMATLGGKIQENTALTGANREEIENKFRVAEGQYKSLQDTFKATLDKTLFLEKNVKDFNERVTALAQRQKETDDKSVETIAAIQTEFKQLGEQFDILKKVVDEKKKNDLGLNESLAKLTLQSQGAYNSAMRLENTANAIAGNVGKNTEDIKDVKNSQFLLTNKLNAFIVDTEKKAEEAIAGQNYLKDKQDVLSKTVVQHTTDFDTLREMFAEVVSKTEKDFLVVKERQWKQREKIGQLESAVDTNAKKVDTLSRTFVEHGDKNKERFLKQASKIGQLENALALLQDKERKNTGVISAFAKHAEEQDAKNVSINNAILDLQAALHKVDVDKQASYVQIANLAEGLDSVKKRTKVLYDVHSTHASRRSVGSGDTRVKTAKPYDVAKRFLNNYLSIVFGQYV